MSFTSENTDSTAVPMMDTSLESADEIVRANLYHLLCRAFSSPLGMEAQQPEQLRRIIVELPSALRDAAVDFARIWDSALENREALSLAYARLFLGPFEILAPPYASFYLESDQRLMGQVSQQAARAYVEAGLEPGEGPREAPDHIALEWEFLYYLTHQYVMTGETHWLEKRKDFCSNHFDCWAPLLMEAVGRAAEHPFYSALAEFVALLFKELKIN